MLISIHDSSLKRMAYADNVVPLAMHYTDDTWRRLLKEATSTFTFKVDMLGRDSEQYLTDNAYISFEYNSKTYLFNVMTITPDSGSKSIIVYCENLSLELLNETKAPIDITVSHNLEWYLNNDGLLAYAGLTIGINEVSDKTTKIKLESEQTGLARLTSIANNFGAELEFVTELNGDGTLKSMTVNFFKKYDGVSQGVGTYRRDLILEYGRNVDGIKRTIDKTDLYNAITPTGKDGMNITSLEKEEYDENGNLEFYTKKGSPNIFAPQSKARYRAQLLNDTDGWLRRYYSADGTSNVNTLYSLALNELKKHAYPAITYEITGFYDLDIGDTVRIVDTSFTPTLIVQARVAEQSICFSDPTKNKTTFGNILALESRVSQDLTGRLKQLVEEAAPYRFEIVSDNGLTFKNSEGNTTLTARVYKGSNAQEVSVDSFEWLIDGVSFGGTTKSQLVNASQVSGTAVVRYNAKINDVVIGGLEVTLQDVSDGKQGVDGKPTGITQSNIEPVETYDGMMWQYTGDDDLPVTGTTAVSGATYVLNDDNWSAYELPKENIIIAKLDDVSQIIGKVLNEFEYTALGSTIKGSVTIDNDIRFKTESTTNTNHPTTEVALSANSNFSGLMVQYMPIKGGTGHQTGYYTQSGIYLQDNINNWNGSITAEQLTLVPWTNLTYLSGFTTAENNPCQYRIVKILDGSYEVQFRGQVKPSSGSFGANTTSYVASIPNAIMPSKNAFGIGIPDFNAIQNARLVVVADQTSSNPRQLQIKVTGNATSYVSLDMLRYVL